jgi:tRNA pseudouridine32 synthase/23S rRNA pseudouridine746 synthase
LTFPTKQNQKKYQPKGGVTILHEDNDIIVIDKPAGIPTIGSDRDKSRTVHTILNEYVRKGNPRSKNRIYVVHRLDRDTSGILIFAKNEQAKNTLQAQWDKTDKNYLAIVHGTLMPKCGTISSYLAENKAFTVYSTQNHALGKLAHTEYTVLKEHNGFSLLSIHLLTGRKHQIRVHMSEKGHAIVGDKKYGRQNDSYKSLALHACSISFMHPISGKQLTFSSPMPDFFTRLIGRTDT